MKAINPTRFSILIGGIPINSGWADGEFFSADPESDTIASVAGTDGEVAVSVQYDRRWNVTLRLLQTSDANFYVSQLWNTKQFGHGMVGFFPFVALHLDTLEFLTAPNACFSRPPTLSVDRTATVREWTILLTDSKYGFAAPGQTIPGG